MEPDISISSDTDWEQLFALKMDSVVDPMILRAGDVFLRGRRGAMATLSNPDRAKILAALTGDIGSLTTFFDQLVLAECLPVIDYGVTFETTLNYETPWICEKVNQVFDDRVLWTVHVHDKASSDAREAALAQLSTCPRPAGELEATVLQHLNALDYEWRPNLGALEGHFISERQAGIQRFLYGGLVFGEFARASGATHVLQPKRAQLSLALALNWPTSQDNNEAGLYAELKKRLSCSKDLEDLSIGFDGLPSVLPYLISKAERDTSPMQLLKLAKTLRESPAIEDYRQWRRELLANWRAGKIDRGHEKDIKRMLMAAQGEISLGKPVEVEAGVEVGIEGPSASGNVKREVDVGQLWWGWVNPLIPGKRYTKLLTRMRVADYELARPGAALSTIWVDG